MTSKKPGREIMRVPEIAARLHVSPRRVRQIIDSGDLPATKGTEWVVFREDVEAYARLRKSRQHWYSRVAKERGKLPSVAERSRWYRRNVRAKRKPKPATE